MKNKIIGLILVIVVIILIVIGLRNRVNNSETVKIGFITFPSGPVALPGQMSVFAAKQAETFVNSNGGINGKKLEVVIGDYSYDTKLAIPTYESLKSQGIRFFMFEGSGAAGTLAPLTKKNGDFLITAVTTLPSYSDNSPLTCRIGLTAANYGPAIANYILSKNKNSRVAMIVPISDYGSGMETEINKILTSGGGTVVDVEKYDQTSGDYRTQLTKIKSIQSKFDYLVVIHTGSVIDSMIKQLKELGISKTIVTDAVTAANPGIKDKNQINGWVVADYEYTSDIRESDSDLIKEFKTKYKELSSFEPVMLASLTYDTVLLLSQAFNRGVETPEDMSNYLINKMPEYKGISGAISFNDDCEVKRPIVYRQFVNGKLVDIK